MPGKEKIYSVDLTYNSAPMPFVIKTMEEIDRQLGGISDHPHRHNYYTIIWSFTATGTHIIDFKDYPIAPNHVFFVSPEQVHQVITDPGPTGYVILFTPEFLEKNSIRKDFIVNLKLFQKCDETPPLALTTKMAGTLKTFADQMLESFTSENELRFEAIGAYLKLFLIECNTHCTLEPGSNTQQMEVGKTLVKSFKELVEKHYFEWHQVKDYAEALYISPNYLNEVIKSSIHISAKEYIQKRLVLEAKRMAVFTTKSIKEIGYDLGFEDPSHFSKFFKSNARQSIMDFKESVVA